MNWYEEYIEPGIRQQVKLLRDNGFNTICSCEHDMYVECANVMDGSIKRLHDTLFNAGCQNYTIQATVNVIDGCICGEGIRIDFLKQGKQTG